jgi:CheY-like chemotaxis protein
MLFSEIIENFKPVLFDIASNGNHAIELIETNNQPDIIFLDLNMPGMGGKEFIKTLKANRSYNGPIVILSTSSSNDDKRECIILGASNFLTKPNTFSELTSMVSSVLIGC